MSIPAPIMGGTLLLEAPRTPITEMLLYIIQTILATFIGARAPLEIARVKKNKISKKFQNSNNLLSPAST